MSRHCFFLSTFFLAAFLVLPSSTAQQFAGNSGLLNCSPAPCVLPPVHISSGFYLVNTPPIVVNPINHKELLVGANDYNCPEFSGPLAAYMSSDRGSTWSRVICMVGIENYSPTILPTVGYDTNGRAFLAGDYEDNEGGGTGFIAVQSSADGIQWNAPVVALGRRNTYATESALAVDTNLSSPYSNRVYVSAVVPSRSTGTMVSHSSDSGMTWKSVNVGPAPTGKAEDHFTSLSIGKEGTVYMTWMHCAGFGPAEHCDNGKAYMVFAKSNDGGETWSAPLVITTVTMPPDFTLPNTEVRVYNYPAIGVDNSDGPYAGNLYVVMYTWTGTYLRIGVIHSSDGGDTWSKPAWIVPSKINHDQFFPWLSVSKTGLVGVSWLDRRNDPANVKYQAFAAISRDGGQHFQPDIQLTSAFSDPNVNGYPDNLWMGDYTGNTWDGSNFVAAWMDSSNGVDMQEVVGGIRVR